MRILLLVHAFNSLSQRIFVDLREAGHELSVEFDINDDVTLEAIELFRPDLVLAPFLKRAIPKHIWSRHICLVVHPGIPGDKGPSALDWAILNDETQWGVTVFQAQAEMDAGPIWAWGGLSLRDASKSSLYRREVTNATAIAVRQAVDHLQNEPLVTPPFEVVLPIARGIARPSVRQVDRKIDWSRDTTQQILKKIRSADGVPGVKDEIDGHDYYLYDAHEAFDLAGKAGVIIATSGPAICRATIDGALWIGHMRDRGSSHPFKLPATHVLEAKLGDVKEIPVDHSSGYRQIQYEEKGAVGYLSFEFYNGAMGTRACQRLLEAYKKACARPIKILVLTGGAEFWSNGMDLNLIEAADNPAEESWQNINAIDDLAEAILTTANKLTIAAMRGNAGAGGVFLARACDLVWLREGTILNPHYKDMGNLYGSEFWTYLLPLHVGKKEALQITGNCLPMGAHRAVELGLANVCLGGGGDSFATRMSERAIALLDSGEAARRLAEKHQRHRALDGGRALAEYRQAELEEMKRNFFGPDPSYHVARYNFVFKIKKSRTPKSLARHRNRSNEKALEKQPEKEQRQAV
ncbi:MAG: hydrogenase maturation protein [bacterium]|nr:hydrogenase maturation protein [bacterium]